MSTVQDTARHSTAFDPADPQELIALRDVPAQLPTRAGRRVHLATVHRWALRGVAGQVLRTVSVGGQRATTLRWLSEWMERVAAARIGSTSKPRLDPRDRRRKAP